MKQLKSAAAISEAEHKRVWERHWGRDSDELRKFQYGKMANEGPAARAGLKYPQVPASQARSSDAPTHADEPNVAAGQEKEPHPEKSSAIG